MDLRLTDDRPTESERQAIDAVVGAVLPSVEDSPRWVVELAPGGPAAQARRSLLLPALHAAHASAAWLSPGAVNYICLRLAIPPAEAYGVATFYALFRLKPTPPRVVHLCDDIACMALGADARIADVTRRVGPDGTPGNEGRSTWLKSPCLGMCSQGPAALVSDSGAAPQEALLGPLDTEDILEVLAGAAPKSRPAARLPQFGSAELRLLRRIGHVDPTSLDSYRAAGGYSSLRQALAIGPGGVIREVSDSKLLGRGGAAFPTGRKWDAVARASARPHYLVCNADESEPGTFKDRVLMEEDPFAIVEAMTIAGFATGCERGYLYVRGEYPLASEHLEHAIAAARARGLLGDDVMGHGFRFDIELRRGAGAYICGEETALFNSIEGFRGEPRNKPPFPVESGLFGKPTVVNNVETLVNVLDIVLEGGPAFANTGTSDSTGTRLFCLSGHVAQPGLYEVPFGETLRGLIERAGGVRGGRPLQAVLLGGAAGSFVTPEHLDVPLTFAGTRAIGASLGSGVVMLFDDQIDLRPIVHRIAAFFRAESCGQCVPCRVGTVRQAEALARLGADRPLVSREGEFVLIGEIGQAMRDASICGLGQTASSAVESAIARLNLFREGAVS